MPDIPEMLSNAERTVASRRLRDIVLMIDRGAPMSSVREAVRVTAYALEEPAWDGLAPKEKAA